MTYKERLMQEHLETDFNHVLDWECPADYGYTQDASCIKGGNCYDCWNREIPDGGGTDDEATG